MKTLKSTSRTLPSTFRVSIYVIVVTVLCILNWTALHAETRFTGEEISLEAKLAAALVPVAEPELVIEDWMLTFADDYAVAQAETEPDLEDWMLTFADDFQTAPAEEAIALEDWMLNFSDEYLTEGAESNIEVESWMVNQDEFLSTPETELTVEDWMVEVSSWTGPVFLVNK